MATRKSTGYGSTPPEAAIDAVNRLQRRARMKKESVQVTSSIPAGVTLKGNHKAEARGKIRK
jgi:hypothetical protein